MIRIKINNRGFSLVNLIMGIAVLGIGSVGIMQLMSSQIETVSNLETIREIAAIKRKIARKMNCGKTLNFDPSTPSLSCSAYSSAKLIPKTKEDKSMIFGTGVDAWQVVGYCDGNELLFKVLSGPKRKSKKQAWSKTKYGKDIFTGTSEFCREFFDPDVPLNWILGGYYTEYVKGGCEHPNMVTSSCSCPSGFQKFKTLDFVDEGCQADFFDQDFSPKCGAIQYSCLKFN